MEREEVYKSLCVRDKRNPFYADLYDDEDKVIARVDCWCDSCFYGTDALAVVILSLMRVLDYYVEQVDRLTS